jgi:bifunctional UDP-N-acetylglucosamine pyrophosphorylase/glucosamine-1-phosphate N-acetyltransferase
MAHAAKPQRAAAPRIAVVLAAGKGTRLRSERPKVLHEVAGRPLLEWVLAAARGAGCRRLLVVVGHGADEVRRRVRGGDDVTWVEQREQLGTGHALAQAEPHVTGPAILVVLSGDVPLVRPATLERLIAAAAAGWGALATAELAEPGGLGRILADENGRIERIVEAADATAEELAIRRVNAGLYALPAPAVFDDLRRLGTDNAKGEHYLTDAMGLAVAAGRPVALVAVEAAEALGVNDRRELAAVHRALLARRVDELMAAGVTVLEPARTVIEPGVEVGVDTVIHPGVALLGRTRIGAECVVHQGAWIRDSTIAAGVEVRPYSVLDGAEVAVGCSVGPFARLRPGSVLMDGAHVGNFVEMKKARLGAGAKASHLAYLGDATVGEGANIGAGVVTCNYDGVAKHPTEIGDGAFVGSDTMLVAPVKVGRGATTGAGSVITQDVPDGALAVGRARQRNIPDWPRRRKK